MTKGLCKKSPNVKDFFENDAWINESIVCGVDEVGRGCLAGPLVTAAVILPKGKKYYLLKDSKLLSEVEREKAFVWIKKHCLYTIGIVNHRVIDQQNIWKSTITAMKKALITLLEISPNKPSAILIDAMPLDLNQTKYSSIPIHSFIKGESKSCSIAAASIVAKVTRDTLMKQMNTLFPGYFFDQHKGYATAKHQASLKTLGSSLIHRQSFTLKKSKDYEEQRSLC